jgi:hypothetical protein
MAWIGMRPFAMSWPPERRAAEAKGAAQMFSHTSTPAVVPDFIAAARFVTSSSASKPASCLRDAHLVRVVEVVDLHRVTVEPMAQNRLGTKSRS